MAIFGNNVGGSGISFDASKTYAMKESNRFLVVTGDNPQELISFSIMQNSSTGQGKKAQVGVFDVTNGVEGSTQVGAVHEFTGEASGGVKTAVLSTPIPLPAGTYDLQFWSDGWNGQVSGVYDNSGTMYKQSAASLQSVFNVNDGAYSNKTVVLYAETQDTILQLDPKILTINDGDPIDTGDTIVLTGSNFGAFGTNSKVTLSLVDNINDSGAFDQTVVSGQWINIAIEIDVVLPSGASPGDVVYVFVTNDTSLTNAIGFDVSVTQFSIYENTIIFEDENNQPVLVESKSGDVSYGFTAFKNDVEAFSITSKNIDLTSTLPLNIQWDDGFKPVAGDIIKIIYDKLLGDLVSEDGEVIDSFVLENENVIICI